METALLNKLLFWLMHIYITEITNAVWLEEGWAVYVQGSSPVGLIVLTKYTLLNTKLRSGPSPESFLAFCNFEYSKFLNIFLEKEQQTNENTVQIVENK